MSSGYLTPNVRVLAPSSSCIFKNEFGEKQTGYVGRWQLLAFLRQTFGDLEFSPQVSPLLACERAGNNFAI